MTHVDTKLARLGRTSAAREQTVNPPLVRASTTLFETVDELRRAREAVAYEVPRYGLYGTTTTFELQSAMAELCGVRSCIATGSGLAAISAVIGAHARPGARILLQNDVYEPTRMFADHELADICDIGYFESVGELETAIDERTSLVFIEVPTSMTMQLIDVRAVAAVTARHGVPLACDSTWGTPLYFDAHGLGIDISIHAGTKYIGGHSDIMLGLVTGSHEALATTRDRCLHHGFTAAPDVCWLGLRGLRTLAVRMARHQASALAVGHWLEQQSQVERVFFPALPSDPHHALWASQFSGAAGLMSIRLRNRDALACERFAEALELFGLGASWGGFESLVLPALDDPSLVRLHIGLEDPDDLIADLEAGLRYV